MLKKGINWQFNPPAASHYGGIWERMIRSSRKAIYGILKEQPLKLNDEGLSTLFCEAEYIINSRPLTANSDNLKDLEPLTPNHFLIGAGVELTAPGSFTKKDVVMGWRQGQYLTNLFWKRLANEYLTTLQERQRWIQCKRNIAFGDVVLIMENSPRNSWPMARVESAPKDDKNVIRSVQLRTKSSTLVRPIAKLILILEAVTS
ncbi:uncharacterized protein [Antedon mediterranea]|uniref:uncharacterized protein n=1 Tax=Antedon mediterranea TaxID=105859 RepID=UPI003AF72CC3